MIVVHTIKYILIYLGLFKILKYLTTQGWREEQNDNGRNKPVYTNEG